MTAGDLITLALKASGVLGVGQTASAEDANDAFVLLNAMLSQWQRKRWLIWHLIDVAYTATGAESYTVGAGGNFNIPRPDRIEAAYARMIYPGTGNAGPVDFPLQCIWAREDYALVALKSLTSFPSAFFYDTAYPMGLLYVLPIPTAQFELHIIVKDQLAQFPTLAGQISLPPEYVEALLWNLAIRLRPLYALPPEPSMTALAAGSLATVRTANAQVPRMLIPASLQGPAQNANLYGVGGVVESNFTLNQSVLG